MDIYYALMGFFIKGGIFMAPIGLVGALALAIMVERYITITRLVVTNRRVWQDVEPALNNADFDAAREKTAKSDTIVARLLGVGLSRLGAVRRIDDIEKALRANLMEVIPHLEKRTHYLATFANLATLLGLLGTVSGLIHAFTAVATANPAEKANLLAASISEAMNCTAFGLMVAVPLLFIHAFLQSKTNQLIGSLETGAVKFLTIVADRQSAKAQTRLEAAQAAHGGRTPAVGPVAAAGARLRGRHEHSNARSFAAGGTLSAGEFHQSRAQAGRSDAGADDRHLHGAGHVPAHDGGVLAHHDPAARSAERGRWRSARRRRSSGSK